MFVVSAKQATVDRSKFFTHLQSKKHLLETGMRVNFSKSEKDCENDFSQNCLPMDDTFFK